VPTPCVKSNCKEAQAQAQAQAITSFSFNVVLAPTPNTAATFFYFIVVPARRASAVKPSKAAQRLGLSSPKLRLLARLGLLLVVWLCGRPRLDRPLLIELFKVSCRLAYSDLIALLAVAWQTELTELQSSCCGIQYRHCGGRIQGFG